MKAASSLRRKAAKNAISSGLDTLPAGLGTGPWSSPSSDAPSRSRYSGVSTFPVTIAFDPHAVAWAFQRRRACQADNPVLGGNVCGHAGYPADSADRGVVDRAVQLAEFSHGRATSLSTSRSTVTSVAMNSARPPPLRISAAACSPTSLRRPPITTVAPSETTRPATARPIPLAPPVTITTLDARRPTMGPIFPQQPRGPGDQRYGSESSVPLPGQPCPPGAEERPPRGRSVRARIAHAGSLVMPVPRPCTAAGMIGRLGDASPILFRGAAFRTRLIARGLVRAAR